MMDRRTFIATVAGGLLAAPLAAEARPARKIYKIGILVGGIPPDGFREGLRDLGYVEGQNVVIIERSAGGRNERFPELVAELLRLGVDALVSSATPAIQAAKEGTKTVPIVMAGLTDPIAAEIVPNLARPGGNITGLTNIFTELSAKRLEFLKQAAPRLSVVAVVWNPVHPGQRLAFKDTEAAARSLAISVVSIEVRRPEDFDAAFKTIANSRIDGLDVLPDPLTSFHRKQTASFAAQHRLAAMYAAREWVEAGGLMSYGPNVPDLWRRAAIYVDKIFKGARPGDLPVERPTKFDLVINLKTAKALGLTIPPSLLQRADQVIE
jgi:ABC-type uncharacterized transport system substrate-binding protein